MTQPSDDAEGRSPSGGPAPAAGSPSSPGYGTPPGYGPAPGPYAPPPGAGYPPHPGYGYPPPGSVPPPGYPPPPAYGPPPGYGYSRPGYSGPQPGYGYPPPGYPRPAPRSPGGHLLAGFGERLLAHLLDGLILTVAGLILIAPPFVILFVAISPDGRTSDTFPAGFFLGWLAAEGWAVLCGFGLSYLYTVEIMWRSGQTVGKRVMKLRVMPLDPNGRLTRGTAAKRWLIQSVAGGVVSAFYLLDGLWQLWDKPFQQTLHDKVAQTVVVKVSP